MSAFYDRDCGNGRRDEDGHEWRCRLPRAPGYNPLGLCGECLAAYREATKLGEGEVQTFVTEPGFRTAPAMGGRGLNEGPRYRSAGPPPGGVPIPGRDFLIGPDVAYETQPGLCPCGCALKASLGPHPGLRVIDETPVAGAKSA